MDRNKWITYHKIRDYIAEGKSVSSISRELNICRGTIYKYKDLDEYEFLRFLESTEERQKKLDPYFDVIEKWIKQGLSKKQIHKNLKNSKNISVSLKTLENFLAKKMQKQ